MSALAARCRYAAALIAAWAAYQFVMRFDVGKPGGLRWKLLPRAGDWAYKDDHGRLSSLAVYLDHRAHVRERTPK